MLLLRLRADLGARPARSHCLPRVLRDAKAGRAVELVGVGASLTGDFAGIIGRDQDRHSRNNRTRRPASKVPRK